MNFFKLQTIANSGRKGSRQKRSGNNVWVIDRGNSIAVKLHNTDVVTAYKDGTIELNSGGWATVTTKKRINQFSPVKVVQKKHVWSLWYKGNQIGLFKNGIKLAYNPSKDLWFEIKRSTDAIAS